MTGDNKVMNIIKIESLIQYMKEIRNIKNSIIDKSDKRLNLNFFYRGQSDESYELKPSICRKNGNYIKYENELISEFKRLKPSEFEHISNDFDLLAKMQHYGLKTRLLDITSNPLIALYFACENQNNKDGEVFLIDSIINYESIHELTIMFSAFYHHYEPIVSDLVLSLEKSHKLRRDMDDGYNANEVNLYVNDINRNNNEPICALPIIFSERQERQQAGFLLFPNKLEDDDYGYVRKFVNDVIDYKKTVIKNMNCRLIVDKNNKEDILDELGDMGIDESFVYPELEYTARKINRKFIRIDCKSTGV